MEISEKQLEDMICLKNTDQLAIRGLDVFNHDHLLRQFNLGSYGIVDLVGITVNNNSGPLEVSITIYELKKDEIGMSALGQLCRYKRAFENVLLEWEMEGDISIVLIGSKIEHSSNFVFAASFVDNLFIYTYDVSIEGLYFSEHNAKDFVPGSIKERGIGKLEDFDFNSLLPSSK